MIRILSMTATFGKLENQTLTLNPRFHLQQAPNEWGKTTWCAFLEAMLYGVPTRGGKAGEITVREQYKPWSGKPMAGVLALEKDGAGITVQRTSTGRGFLNNVTVYETESNTVLPGFTADNVGEKLLGITREVFKRTCFLKESMLPVDNHPGLMERLNAIVTTGDDSGDRILLEKKLKELKNKCYVNSSKGLLPQTQAELREIEDSILKTGAIERSIRENTEKRELQAAEIAQLQLHLQWLDYRDFEKDNTALADARKRLTDARTEAQRADAAVTVTAETLDGQEQALRELTQLRDQLHREAEAAGRMPPVPEAPRVFSGLTAARAEEDARRDAEALAALEKKRRAWPLWAGAGICALAGIGLLFVQVLAAVGAFAAAAVLFLLAGITAGKAATEAAVLKEKYRPLAPGEWVAAAVEYGSRQKDYTRALQHAEEATADLRGRMEEVNRRMGELTGGIAPAQFAEGIGKQRKLLAIRAQAAQEVKNCELTVTLLEQNIKPAERPAEADCLTYTEEDTQMRLRLAQDTYKRLDNAIAQFKGELSHYGDLSRLEQLRQEKENRVAQLQKINDALVLATETCQEAQLILQKKFAPGISKRTQELFGMLTGGRYSRLTLDGQLQVQVATDGETDLKSINYRSDGTVDQLYLAMRLAVLEQIAPEAPMILDDALIRFDDTRLAKALEVLKAQERQIVVFTCQGREKDLAEREK